MIVPAAVHIQLVEILDNGVERMAEAFVAILDRVTLRLSVPPP
jgi:hypothetical protein